MVDYGPIMESLEALRPHHEKSALIHPYAALVADFYQRHTVLIVFAAFALAVLVFYWVPLTDRSATPQWDTIDQHYSPQKFAAEELKNFRLPHWSEFSYSGFPFLADPQVGVWYPFNWPFFLLGITPKIIQLEIAIHAMFACWGMWLLANLWLENAWAAAFAAIAFSFSGFFAGHSSHLGMFQTAAWLPLLLFGVHSAIRSPRLIPALLTGAGCACMFLAGHFQTALYSFAAIGSYAAAVAAMEGRWLPSVRVVSLCVTLTILLSAVQWMPTQQLVSQSARSEVTYISTTNSQLKPRTLVTMLSPNHYGAVHGKYVGPYDKSQFYFYAGFLLLPLALLGLISGRVRWAALTLIVPFVWYAFGPSTGLYDVLARLPGFGHVRAPVHDWFIVALGLALLAGAGLAFATNRFKSLWLAPVVVLISFSDLLYLNLLSNQLAFGHASFQEHYGDHQNRLASAVRRVLPEGTRFHAPFSYYRLSPWNFAYDVRVPVTFGYNPLPLKRYQVYMEAAKSNPALLNALHVGAYIMPETGAITVNTSVLPKFFFPKGIRAVDPTQNASFLATANPLERASVEGDISGFRQDPSATVSVQSEEPCRYTLRINAATPSLLRTAIPWYPAWTAMVDGKPVSTLIVDHAMLGIPIPAKAHTVSLEYSPDRFRTGAALSLGTALVLAALLYRLRVFPPPEISGSFSSPTTT